MPEAVIPHHVVQIIILIIRLSVDFKGKLSQDRDESAVGKHMGQEKHTFPHLQIHLKMKSERTQKMSLTDFSLETLEARLSARRRFSASSRSSTELPEQKHRNPVRKCQHIPVSPTCSL